MENQNRIDEDTNVGHSWLNLKLVRPRRKASEWNKLQKQKFTSDDCCDVCTIELCSKRQ